MKCCENIVKALCHELEKLDKKYAGDVEMSMQDLEMIRLLYSSLVKSETYDAMKDDSGDDEWEETERGNRGRKSDRRGRTGYYPEYMPPHYGGRY